MYSIGSKCSLYVCVTAIFFLTHASRSKLHISNPELIENDKRQTAGAQCKNAPASVRLLGVSSALDSQL